MLIQKTTLSKVNMAMHHVDRLSKNSRVRLLGLLLLSVANFSYAQTIGNPFVTAICNVANLFSTPLITAIAFIATAFLIILVMVTEARGAIGSFLKVLICTVGLLSLKSLISTFTGYSFGC